MTMDVSIPCCNECNTTSTTDSTTHREAAVPPSLNAAQTKLNMASDMISVGPCRRRFSTGAGSSCSSSADMLSTSMSSSCCAYHDGGGGLGGGVAGGGSVILDGGFSTHSSRSATSSNAEASKGETILNERFRKYGIVPLNNNNIHSSSSSSNNNNLSNNHNSSSTTTSRKNRSFLTSSSSLSSSSVPSAMSVAAATTTTTTATSPSAMSGAVEEEGEEEEKQPSFPCHLHDSRSTNSTNSTSTNNLNSFNHSDSSPSLQNTASASSSSAAAGDTSDLPEQHHQPQHHHSQEEDEHTDENHHDEDEASIVDGVICDGGGDVLQLPPPVTSIESTPQHILSAVEEIHRWLFVEGGHIGDVETLMMEYASFVRDRFSVPLDRFYYGGLGLHPKLTAYLWRWEQDDFEHREMPQDIFARRNEIFSKDEPFCVMEQGRAPFIRHRLVEDKDLPLPPDMGKWFRSGGYTDYFALPDIHQGVSKGGMAWATKCPEGFRPDDILLFKMTFPALATIMRLHTNDLALKILTERMEKEIEERTSELAKANEHISKQSAMQLEHFASMSHEIRTPLNCVVGMSSMLLDDRDGMTDDHYESVKMIHSSADLLRSVVDDVLDYAKLESGNFEVNIERTDLQSTLDGVIHSISQKVAEKSVRVRSSYCGMLPQFVDTDSRRLQQILFNLLGNAAKFSRPNTSIDVVVRLSDHEEEKRAISFSVTDYGKGIDEEHFESIFKPFSQASKETQTVYGGTGLGLSITRKLVEKLGGTIAVSSEISKFTTFEVKLPYDGTSVDLSTFGQKLSDTTIVLVDPTERFTANFCMEDKFMPICPALVQKVGLDVVRCPDFASLQKKLSRREKKANQYVVIVHEAVKEQDSGRDITRRLLGEKNIIWFTSGMKIPPLANRHFKALSGTFPSIVFDRILTEITQHRQDLQNQSSDTRELQQDISRSAVTVRSHSLSNSVSPTVNSQDGKKSKTYTPRDLHVLIAEDNLVNQKVLNKVLSRLGVSKVDIVDNGLKAVEHSEGIKYDLILMDVDMPVMDGFEACERIVAREGSPPVVFVTAHALSDFKDRAESAGGHGFISKPFNIERINELLSSLYD